MGGLIAGTLDLLQACILFGAKIPLVIAAGLLGRQALKGGMGTYVLAFSCTSLAPPHLRPFTARQAAGLFF
jgi:hypothetical protein